LATLDSLIVLFLVAEFMRSLAKSIPIAFLMTAGTMLIGCVSDPSLHEEPVSVLPQAPLSEKGVVLEIGFAEVSLFDEEWQTVLWNQLDEQHLSADTRQALLSNGLRCGLAGEQLPEELRTAIEESTKHPRADQIKQSVRRLHFRAGSRSEIVTTSNDCSMTLLLDDGHSVSGHQFHAAQALFGITAQASAAGRAEISLVPEIHFGASKQKYVGKDGAFVLATSRDNQTFGELAIDTKLAPGQTLVVSCDGPAKSLGGNFFVDAGEERLKLLLIRLAHAPQEDLFDDSNLFDTN
jgi:hypothetical protein